MVRSLALLLLLAGCDVVLGLDIEAGPPVCGPYGEPQALVFDSRLEDPHDFSVDGTGIRGMVSARRTNAQNITWTGPHAIKPAVDGMWIPDDVRDRPNLNSLSGAHMVTTLDGKDQMVGWIEKPRTPAIFEYTFQTTAWGMVPGPVDPFIAESTRAGNVIEIKYSVASQKWAVLIEIAQVTGQRNNLRINQLDPSSSWQLTSQATLLEMNPLKLNPNGGVLTGDHEKLLYSARVGKNMHSELFASLREDDKFAHGPELIIKGVASDADLTEPWINADCSTVYFRSGEVTWMASLVDDTGSSP